MNGWKNRQIREQVDILDGKRSPTILLYNATYLHGILKQWIKGNIWIYGDRIVYAGEQMPPFVDENCEKVNCENFFLVPGYIEPHAHPFQLYNPQTFAEYAGWHGTTVLICDNLTLFLYLEVRKALSMIGALQNLPATFYWWSRFDSQTELINEEQFFSNSNVKSWLDHHLVVQGGELTGWPKLVSGDNLILHWVQLAKNNRKRVEGHFPGASEKTLAKLKLLGADADHEALTGEDVKKRLLQGYMVSLRYSSIRPDLPEILNDIKEIGPEIFSSVMLTTDGSSPSFYQNGVMDHLIQIAMDQGITPVDAYLMATLNPARYFQLDHLHGIIATGRIADINFLESKEDPFPISVLSKGVWVKKDKKLISHDKSFALENYGFTPLKIDWELSANDLEYSTPIGIQMVNAVITKPYSISSDFSADGIDPESDENFFLFIDRKGEWRLNTVIKGFTKNIGGFASSFSGTGDIILVGKRKADLLKAFAKMKEMGGGIVICDDGEIIYELPLPLGGVASDLPLEKLMEKERQLKKILAKRGYPFDDPVYSLLFFSSTHLPYIRTTQIGLYDVMKKKVLFPSVMR